MAKVAPYYSLAPTDLDVYHDHDNCPSGQRIPYWNKRQGTNNYRRCEHCQRMGLISAKPAGLKLTHYRHLAVGARDAHRLRADVDEHRVRFGAYDATHAI